MGDLFHKDVDTLWLLKILIVISECPQHKFLFLTKRPEIMRDRLKRMLEYWDDTGEQEILKNLWLGVTVELNKYRWRIDELEQIPADVRFVSFEPTLGPIPEIWEYFQWQQFAV